MPRRHLHQRVDEQNNKSASTSKHHRDKHCVVPKDRDKKFHVFTKCKNKFECLLQVVVETIE